MNLRGRWRESVFARLVVIMVTLTLSLLALVSVFFGILTREVHDRIDLRFAHDGLLLIALVVIVAVVFTAHVTLRHLLRPLRTLNDGVARLGAGELDVHLERASRDEFAHLTDAFNQMAARVREMVVSRDRLLVDVSHELRSPLTRMRVAVELLPEVGQRGRLTEDLREMEQMVTGLLELERLRAPCGLQLRRLDLVPLLRDVATPYEHGVPGLRLALPAQPLFIDVDAVQIRSLVRNLLENAMKYSLPDSHAVEMALSATDGGICVRVADDGPGVPEGEVERVFEPFYRVDPSRSRVTGGYGLGLSICRRIAEAHGGTIVVERGTDRGATFVVSLPRIPAPPS